MPNRLLDACDEFALAREALMGCFRGSLDQSLVCI
jgi:hypothetical protein